MPGVDTFISRILSVDTERGVASCPCCGGPIRNGMTPTGYEAEHCRACATEIQGRIGYHEQDSGGFVWGPS